jgi:hypothetical protein
MLAIKNNLLTESLEVGCHLPLLNRFISENVEKVINSRKSLIVSISLLVDIYSLTNCAELKSRSTDILQFIQLKPCASPAPATCLVKTNKYAGFMYIDGIAL